MNKQEITDWINANYPDNNTGSITPESLRSGLTQTLDFADKRLIPSVTVYVNGYGTLGNDANDGFSWQKPLKTFRPVAERYNNRVYHLTVIIPDETFLTEDITLAAPHVTIRLEGAAMLNFALKTLTAGAINFKGHYGITMYGTHTVDLIAQGSGFYMEGHGPAPAGLPETVYRKAQGGIILAGPAATKGLYKRRKVSYLADGALTMLEDNSVFITTEEWQTTTIATDSGFDDLSIQEINTGWPLSVAVAPSAKFSTLQGGRTFLRQYHPLNSTDTNVWEGETVLSPTNNKLWTKRGGTIRDAMGTVFS